MATTVGAVWVDVLPSMRNFTKDLRKGVTGSTRGIGEQAGREIGDGVSDTVGRSGSEGGRRAGENATSSMAQAIRAGASRVGAAVDTVSVAAAAGGAAAFSDAFSTAMDLTRAQSTVTAQLGLSAAESERIGTVAGDLFASGYGQSMDDVANAIRGVGVNISDLSSLSDTELQKISQRALGLADIMGEDVSRVTRGVGQLMRNELVPDAEEAFDLIARASQSLPQEMQGELIDTIEEYSADFRQLGLDGPAALGAISSAIEAGARNTDLAADALREFSIRALDGSDTTAEGFEAIGLNAQEMVGRIEQGGPSAQSALSDVIQGIQDLDGAAQEQAGVALFGTQFENLGIDALAAMDPATAALTDFTGAADTANEAMRDNTATQLMTAYRGVASVLVEELAPPLMDLADWMQENPGQVRQIITVIGALAAAFIATSVAMRVFTVLSATFQAGRAIVSGATTAASALGRMRDGFQSTQAAQSAFSGRMGTIGGVLRKGWDAAAGAVRTGASAVATGAQTAWSAISTGASNAAGAVRRGGTAAMNAARSGWDTLRLRAMYAGDAIKAGGTAAANAARSGLETLRLRAMYAGDAIRSAGQRAADAARSGLTTAGQAARTAGQSAMSSIRHWRDLATEQGKTAAAATRARVATIASTVAQKAAAVASRVWAVAVRVLNAAMAANPIGLVVVAIVALIGVAIWAYKEFDWFRNVVQTAWAGIQTAALWAWNNVLKPIFDGLVSVIQTYVIPAVMWLWQNVLVPAFQGIAAVITWAWQNVIQPVFRLYVAYIQGVIIPVVLWLWNNVITPAFQAISAIIRWAWNNVIKPAFTAIHRFVSGTLGPIFRWLWNSVITPAWNGIKAAINVVWVFVRDRVFSPMRDGIGRVGDAFDAGKDAIKTAWDGIKDAAKAPVRFLVNTVYNRGVVPMWNKVAGLVGADELKTLSLPEGFARGGILPGYSTWRQGDDQLVPMRRGEGVAISEAMRVPALRSELLRWNAIGVRGGTGALRRYAGEGFARGGVFGGSTDGVSLPDIPSLLVDLASKGASAFAGLGSWEDAINVVVTPIRRALSAIGKTGLQGIPYMATGTIRDKLVEWLDGNALGGGGGAPVGSAKGVPGRVVALARAAVGKYPEVPTGSNTNAITRWYGLNDQWCAMFISWLFAQANASGSLKRAKRTAWTGDYYGSGMRRVSSRAPGDVLVYGTRHVNLSLGGRATIGGNESNNVRYSSAYPGSPAIFRPDWKGMAKGGVVGRDMLTPSMLRRIGSQDDRQNSVLYDTGGWLQPGLTLVSNQTGKPEPVLTNSQWRQIGESRTTREGPLVENHQHFERGGADDFADAADELVFKLRKARRGGVFAGVS